MSFSISARSRTPPAARNDSAIGKLRPWTQQKAEAERRVNNRKNHRAAEIKAKKLEQDKVHAQSPADRQSDPKVRQAEKETTAQLGKVFAAYSMSAPKTADGLCKDLRKLLKPATDRNYRPLDAAGVSTQDQLNASEERYRDWIGDLATQSLKKLTDAELKSVATGLDGTHFSSDAIEVFVISKAITDECKRRCPQPEAAKKACTKLGEGKLSDALSEMKKARGGRDNPLDWKTAMVDAKLEDSQLLAIIEKFRPEKDGKASQATQLLGSLNHIAKGPKGNEQARQAGNDMGAIVTAARELLDPEGRHKLDYLAGVETYAKQAPLSEDENVRAALRDGLGLEIGEPNKPIAVHSAAQAVVNPEVLQPQVAPKDPTPAGPAAEARPADESPNLGDAKVLTKQAAMDLLGLKEGYTDAQFNAAKDPALIRGKAEANLDEVYKAFDTLQPHRPDPRARRDIGAEKPAVIGAEHLKNSEAAQVLAERNDALAQLGLNDKYTKEEFEAARYRALSEAVDDEEALLEVGKAIELLDPPRPPVARAVPPGPRDVQPNAQSVEFNRRALGPVAGQPVRTARTFTYNQFNANVVLDATNNPIYAALKALSVKEHNEVSFEFLEQASKYGKNEMKDWERANFGRQMKEFVATLNLSGPTKISLGLAMSNNWDGFTVALAAAVKEIQKDVMQNTFKNFLLGMANGKSGLRGENVGIAQRYLEGLAPTAAVGG